MTTLLETRHIEETKEGVTILLNILGHPETLVTDYTRVGDFEGGVETLRSLALDCKPGDFLYDIARQVQCGDE